jgi:lipopolysaccharide transport system ATP-binding protein
MTDVAVRCEGLAKQYRIGERESYKALRDVIMDAFVSPFRRLRSVLLHSSNGSEKRNIWALRDVTFEIKRGEVVGIIGRNGAGKSTLLKILSRITEPTHGHADIWGRVGSLLEVGTGFHPELTGRDNIFLNGAILGMRRAEIARKFDEIVAFAEVDKFIDTPVKRYSSGMYVRLAFAVAAHTETDILMVDEVLAVGDAQFQQKCLGKMDDVAKQGRTVLFVSHTMPSVQRLCSRGVLLENGSVKAEGRIDTVIESYLAGQVRSQYAGNDDGNLPCITNANARWNESDGIRVDVIFVSHYPLKPPVLGLVIHDALGVPIFGTNAKFDPQPNLPESMRQGTITVYIPTESLRFGVYYISLWLGDRYQDYCHVDRGLRVEVGIGAEACQPPRSAIGSVRLKTRWNYSGDIAVHEPTSMQNRVHK